MVDSKDLLLMTGKELGKRIVRLRVPFLHLCFFFFHRLFISSLPPRPERDDSFSFINTMVSGWAGIRMIDINRVKRGKRYLGALVGVSVSGLSGFHFKTYMHQIR